MTNTSAQTQDVAGLSRDTTNTNGTVANTPDVNAILNQQADTMQAAQAAGQVVAQGIGVYADHKRDTATDAATEAAWDEGGANRTMLHIAGGALIGGLGGGAFDAFGGAVGAGLASGMATATLGWIIDGGKGASATDNFMNGDGNQFLVSLPTQLPVNVVAAITHAYGGSTAVEVGVSSPGDLSVSISPWSHTTPVINNK